MSIYIYGRSYCQYKRDKKIKEIKDFAESVNELQRIRKRKQDETLINSKGLLEDV